MRFELLRRRLVFPFVLVLLRGVLAASPSPADEPPPRVAPLHGESSVRFATIDEGRARLRESDAFTRAMSRFDRQVRLATDREAGEAEILKHSAEQVVEWSDGDVRRVSAAAASLGKRLAGLHVPLPREVLLIQTNGKDESDAAYCRYPAVILPSRRVAADDAAVERLLAHELFHIVSRHDPVLRAKLYSLVGFTSCEPIEPPAALRDRKLTNPDAPVWDSVITLAAGDRRVVATPILIASVEKFDPQAGGSLFKFLQFRALVVEPAGEGRWAPKLTDGKPELLDPRRLDDYGRQIGKNTGYVIHPDEILADNFVHAVFATPGLPNPELVEKLRAALRAP